MPFALDQQHDCSPRPQRKIELQLFRTLFRDQARHLLFLFGGQTAAAAHRPSVLAHIQAANALLFITLHNHARSSVTQANLLRDPMPIHASLIGSNHLTPAIMLRRRTLLPCILLLHVDRTRMYNRKPEYLWAESISGVLSATRY